MPIDPFGLLGSAIANVVTDSLTAAMLALWNAGLWLLRLALTFLDFLLTPDLSEDGPGAWLYQVMFWIAAALLLEGRPFIENIFYKQIYRRAFETWHHPQPFYHYLLTLPLAYFQARRVGDTVARHKGNISAAARELGITRTTLYRKLRQASPDN